MAPSKQAPVLIVGAGPAGLVAALTLAQNKVPVRVIDKAATPQIGSRGSGLQPRTLELFKFLGVLPDMLQVGLGAPIVRYYAPPPNGHTMLKEFLFTEHMEPTDDTPISNTAILSQSLTTKILRTHLESYGVVVETSTQLVSFTQDSDGVTATLAKLADGDDPNGTATLAEETVTVPWVIGTDGARGVTRKLLGLSFLGETREGERMILINAPVEGVEGKYWHTWGETSRISVVIAKLETDSNCLILFMGATLEPGHKAGTGDLAAVTELFQSVSGRMDIKIGQPYWASEYRPNIRMAENFREGRVFIAGDAAHCHSSTGGQGLNTSVHDAANLGWKLALAYHSHASQTLLDTYVSERLPVVRSMLQITTDLHNRTFASVSGTREQQDPRTRAVAYAGEAGSAFFRGHILKMLEMNYRWSEIVVGDQNGEEKAVEVVVDPYRKPAGVIRPGDRAPDARLVYIGTQEETTLFDLFKLTHHTVLVFSRTPTLALQPVLQPYPASLIKQVVILPVGAGAPSATGTQQVLVDLDGKARRIYSVPQTATGDVELVVIVRPDGFIGGMVTSVEGVERYFKGVFA